MPCRCDHMEPTSLEIETSKVAYLLDEIESGEVNSSFNGGTHPDVYGKCDQTLANNLTARLCDVLKETGASKYSLEMQIWWRDHQAKDRKREQEEKSEREQQKIRKAALSKLTKREKEALGLK
jgi:hypothetical protein